MISFWLSRYLKVMRALWALLRGLVQLHSNYSLNEADIKESLKHFTSYDKIFILKDIVDFWRYHPYVIKSTGGTLDLRPKNKADYMENEISRSRFESRREKLNIEIAHHHENDKVESCGSNRLAPEKFINKDEIITFHSCREYFFLDNTGHKVLGVAFNEWIRAFTVLKIMSNEHLKNRILEDLITLQNLCLVVCKEDLKRQFINYGINKNSVSKIIERLVFSPGDTDLFDTPLLNVTDDQLLIVPSIMANMDVSKGFDV
ncbi:hypothetical protein [Paenibacillus sp. J31TS4]|uniref:hypothetical protein n=1 Tax=Paenibacillus sp. J31TS4 TaxID=2807195 RepID=UPI001BD06ED1|nr:hypothetical protein [Paenibacillus sp. J31TS4]